jgi:phosphate transport system substrate-binding protein
MNRCEPSLRCLLAVGVAAAAGFGCKQRPVETPTSGHLAIAVAESHAPLLQREAELFASLYPKARIDIHPVSTREAFVALLADSVRLALVDREPNAEEKAAIAADGAHIENLRIAEDALAVLVQASNALPQLSRAQLAELLAGRIRDWAAIPGATVAGPVRIVTTGRNSGAWELLAARFFPDVALLPPQVVATQQEVLAAVGADPTTLGIVAVAAWKETPATAAAASAAIHTAVPATAAGWATDVATGSAAVRAVAIAAPDSLGNVMARALHQANIHTGAYPLHYPVFVCFDSQSRLATGFAAFLASAPGQKRILDTGLVPATMPVRLVQLQ